MSQTVTTINGWLEGRTLVATVYDTDNSLVASSSVVTEIGDGAYSVVTTYAAGTKGHIKVLDGTTVVGVAAIIPEAIENADIKSSALDTHLDAQDTQMDAQDVLLAEIISILGTLELDDLSALLKRLRPQSNAQSQTGI